MIKELAPIVLFVYDRPEHAKRVVEGLLLNPEAKDSVLYIFSDGPKTTASEDTKKRIEETRKYIRTIKGFKNVVIEAQEENKGLAPSTIDGCKKVLDKHESMIVLEDDDVPNEYFLKFMNRSLEKYKDDELTWSISGFTDTGVMTPRGVDDIFLINRFSSWGYATWKRCWDKTIWDIATIKKMFANKALRKAFGEWGGRDLPPMMQGLFAGRNSSWSVRFNFSCFLNNAKNIHTTKSLVENIGCDGTGTHSGKAVFNIEMFDRDVVLLDKVMFDEVRNRQMCQSHHRYPTTLKGKIGYVIKKWPWLHKILKQRGLCK